MKLKSAISQIEYNYGRVPKNYVYQLINDCLDMISTTSRMYKTTEIMDLVQAQRLYSLPTNLLEIERVDILDSNSRYSLIPFLSGGFHLLKNDADKGKGDYTASNSSETGSTYRNFPNDYFAWFTEGDDLSLVVRRGSDDNASSDDLDTLATFTYDTYNGNDVSEGILITYKGKYNHVEDSQLESDLKDSTGLPEALHQSIIDGIKYKLSEDKGDLQTAMYFKQKFDTNIKKYPYSKNGARRILPVRV